MQLGQEQERARVTPPDVTSAVGQDELRTLSQRVVGFELDKRILRKADAYLVKKMSH